MRMRLCLCVCMLCVCLAQGHALSVLGFHLLHREGLMAKFKIKPVVMARWVQALCNSF